MHRTFIRDKIDPIRGACKVNPLCIDVGPIPLMKNIRTDLIDPATPQSARKMKSGDGKDLKLVVCVYRRIAHAPSDARPLVHS
jgi:hypothetical protein